MIKDFLHQFTTIGTPYAPTATGDNLAPLTYDCSPLGLPTGSGGGGATGFNAGSSVNAGRDLGLGGEMWWNVVVTTAVTSSGAATVQFFLGTDAAQTLASFVSSTGVGVVTNSAAIGKATLILGYTYRAQLPQLTTYLQYIGFVVTIAVQTLTAGAFESELVLNIQQADLYLSGYVVQ